MMKNRFRFRAWDKILKSYLKPVNFVDLERASKDKDIVIEQCTGLKDKNGRLIYEGDIIQHDTAAGPKCWPVVFKNGCFVLPYESGEAWLGKVIEHCPYDSGVVIAGNIHENPELLEANNGK